MQHPFRAEILGPAGAGKSTLTRALARPDLGVRTGLSIWGLPITFLAAGAVASIATLVTLWHRRRCFEPEDSKLVIQIYTLSLLLRRKSSLKYRALMMDEGTVFALAQLRAFGPEPGNAYWMQPLFNRVAPTIDAIIWLDAPDTVLARRIRERDKPHRTKHATDQQIFEHLASYRSAFEEVVAELGKRRSFSIIRFNTEMETLSDITAKVSALVQENGSSVPFANGPQTAMAVTQN